MERGSCANPKQHSRIKVRERLVKYKRAVSIWCMNLLSMMDFHRAKRAKLFSKQNSYFVNRKVKCLLVFLLLAIIVVSIFGFLPRETQSAPNIEPDNESETQSNNPSLIPSPTTLKTPSVTKTPETTSSYIGRMINMASGALQILAPPKLPGIIESAEYLNSTVWKVIAANSWQYFKPGIGVDPITGLPGAGLGYPYFTDWDLGVYVQAVIDANRTGLITSDGEWGFNARVEKVLQFLEKRELNETTNFPFWFYEAATGKNYKFLSDSATAKVDAVDTGKLFVSLNNLRIYNSDLKSRINNIVISGRSNYSVLLNDIKSESGSNSIYTYYVISGFAAFWPEVADVKGRILNNILGGIPVSFGANITLPISEISCEPLLHSIFELENNTKIIDLAKNVSLAHEARFNSTGQYVAFSEGNSGYNTFIYEWVILPSGETWKVTNVDRSNYENSPIAYTKIALSFLALYNTTYARNLALYLEQNLPDPANGYYDGSSYSTDESNRILVTQVGSNTNGLILSAARYALNM